MTIREDKVKKLIIGWYWNELRQKLIDLARNLRIDCKTKRVIEEYLKD